MEKTALGEKKKKRNKTKFRPYYLAIKFVHKMRFKNQIEWKAFAQSEKCPADLPIHPELVYLRRGWQGWHHFLGKSWYTYEEARKIVAKFDIMNGKVWKETVGRRFPRPSRMPLCPDLVYKKEWVDWPTFLGQDRARNRYPDITLAYSFTKGTHYRPFAEAMKYVSKLGLHSYMEYIQWRKTYPHDDLPWRPDEVYDIEWIDWGSFLGKKPLPALMADVSVLYVGRRPTDPLNVYRIQIEALGKSELVHKAKREGFIITRMWKYDPTLKEEVRQVIDTNARSYGSDHEYMVENIHGLFGDLMGLLLLV